MPDVRREQRAGLRMIVSGRVQGVFFRAATAERARILGIVGYARNRDDGTVEIVAEGADADGVLRERILGELGGFAESDDACNIFGAGTETALVVAAVEELLQRRAGADVERADSFGAVDFVCGDGEQVEMQGVYVDGTVTPDVIAAVAGGRE